MPGQSSCRTATTTAKTDKDPLCDTDGATAKDSVKAGDLHLSAPAEHCSGQVDSVSQLGNRLLQACEAFQSHARRSMPKS